MQNSTELASKNNNNENTYLDICLYKYIPDKPAQPKKLHKTTPALLVTIMFTELKAKQERNKSIMLNTLFYSGASSLLVSESEVLQLKKVNSTETLFHMVAGECFTN